MNESAKRKKRKRSKDKGAPRQWVEYVLLVSLLGAVRALPYGVCRAVAAAAGEAIFRLVPRRRRIARANLRIAFPELGEAERLALARRSCRSFVLTGLEGAKFLARFDPRRAREMMPETVEGGEEVLKNRVTETLILLYCRGKFLSHVFCGDSLTVFLCHLKSCQLLSVQFGQDSRSDQWASLLRVLLCCGMLRRRT